MSILLMLMDSDDLFRGVDIDLENIVGEYVRLKRDG